MTILGPSFRIRATNTHNQNITVTVRARYFKFSSDGALVVSTEQTLLNGVTLTTLTATTGTTVSGTVDNTGTNDRWLGMFITATFTAAATTNSTGSVTLTLERSTDAGTTWPTADRGIFIGAESLLAADGTSARLRNFTLR